MYSSSSRPTSLTSQVWPSGTKCCTALRLINGGARSSNVCLLSWRKHVHRINLPQKMSPRRFTRLQCCQPTILQRVYNLDNWARIIIGTISVAVRLGYMKATVNTDAGSVKNMISITAALTGNHYPLQCRGNYNATLKNIKFVYWMLMGELLHLVQRGGDWAGPQPAQAPPRCTKCNSQPINSQCTNHRTVV